MLYVLNFLLDLSLLNFDHLLHLVDLLVVLGYFLLHHIEIDVSDASLMLKFLLSLSDELSQLLLLHSVKVLVWSLLLEVVVIVMQGFLDFRTIETYWGR